MDVNNIISKSTICSYHGQCCSILSQGKFFLPSLIDQCQIILTYIVAQNSSSGRFCADKDNYSTRQKKVSINVAYYCLDRSVLRRSKTATRPQQCTVAITEYVESDRNKPVANTWACNFHVNERSAGTAPTHEAQLVFLYFYSQLASHEHSYERSAGTATHEAQLVFLYFYPQLASHEHSYERSAGTAPTHEAQLVFLYFYSQLASHEHSYERSAGQECYSSYPRSVAGFLVLLLVASQP